MIKKIFSKDKILIYSQFLSVLLFAIVLIPKFIQAIEPQEVKTYVEVKQPVTLNILPEKGTYSVGDALNVQVSVHIGNQPINAVGFELLFPHGLVKVVSIDTKGSICTLFPEQKINNNTGIITFSCGLPNPGFSDSYGLIGTVNLKFKKSGFVNLSFSKNSQILANDGFGTNILDRTINAGYNVVNNNISLKVPAKENDSDKKFPDKSLNKIISTVLVESPTHPDSQKWYRSNKVKLICKGQTEDIRYSYVLDNKPDTTPDQSKFLSCWEIQYVNLDDGIWYFHIMQNSLEASGPVTHFKFQIDSKLPDNLKVVNAVQTSNKNEWQLEFSANDEIGILYYEIEFENGLKVRTQDRPKIQLENKYKNNITITAYDLSGNSTTINYDIPTRENESFWDKIVYMLYSIWDFLKNL